MTQDHADRKFHAVMGTLLAFSLVVDQQDYELWRAGQVSMVSLALAMVWMGLFAWEGFRRRDEAARVLRHRLDEMQEQVDELTRDARTRRGPL